MISTKGVIIIIGIVGKTGSGKSSVSNYLKNRLENVLIIDVDETAKKIYERNSNICLEIGRTFGNCVYDGSKINYSILANKVFSDPKELAKLNKLMFPLIQKEIEDIIIKNSLKKTIIIDAAILFACKIDKFCDYIIWIKSDKKNRLKFLTKKNPGKKEADLLMRIEGQKINICKGKIDFIINNNNSLSNLYKKTEKILSIISENES